MTTIRGHRLAAFVLAALVALTGIALAQPLQDLLTLRNLPAVTRKLMFDQDFPLIKDGQVHRCVVNQFSVPGQGLHSAGSGLHQAGSTGGMFITQRGAADGSDPSGEYVLFDAFPPARAEPPRSVTALGPTADLLRGLANAANENVAILVPDEYAGEFAVPAEIANIRSGQGDTTVLTDLRDAGRLRHGALVLNELNGLILGTGAYKLEPAAANRPPGTFVWRNRATGASLTVEAVDLGDMAHDTVDTEAIASAINAAIEKLASAPDRPSVVVINLSWVLLPCATVRDFEAARDDFATFRDYVGGLAVAAAQTVGGDPQDPALLKYLLQLLVFTGDDPDDLANLHSAEDPFFSLPTSESFSVRALLVAASGNFNLDYPMLPAAVPSFIGVGAPRPPQVPPPFADLGDVTEKAAWYLMSDPIALERTGSEPGYHVAYAGTSFSAPVVSLYAALEVAAGGACAPGRTLGLTRPTGHWANLTLLSADAQCTSGPN